MVKRTHLVLILILAVQLVLGVLYAVRTPRWQAPDEPAHFNYVRGLVETGRFPVLTQGDYDQAYLERIKAAKFPPDLPIDSIRYEAHQPPLYYLLAAPLYLSARALQWDAALALRILNVVLGLVLSVVAFWVYREVWPENPLLQLAGVGFLATLPMHLAMSAAINNDTLAEVVLAAIVLLAVRRVQGKLAARRFWIVGGIAYAIALLTKTTIYTSALVLIAAELGYRRIAATRPARDGTRQAIGAARMPILRAAVGTLAPLFGMGLVLSLPWFTRNAQIYGWGDLLGWARHDAVVAGQPTTAQWITQFGLRNVVFDFLAISFKSFWAQFGWMGVLVSDRIYALLFVLTAIASLGAVLWIARLVRERETFPAERRWTWLLLSLVLLLAAAAHIYYNLKYVQPQGRYLFPGLIAIAAFGAAGWYELLQARHAYLVFGVLYGMMVVLDYICLAWYIVPQLVR